MSDNDEDNVADKSLSSPGRKFLKAKRSISTDKVIGTEKVGSDVTCNVLTNTVMIEGSGNDVDKLTSKVTLAPDIAEELGTFVSEMELEEPTCTKETAAESIPMEVDASAKISNADSVIGVALKTDEKIWDVDRTVSVANDKCFVFGAYSSKNASEILSNQLNLDKQQVNVNENIAIVQSTEKSDISDELITKRQSDGSTADFLGFDVKTDGQEIIDISDDDDETPDNLVPKYAKRVDCCNLQCTTTTQSKVQLVDAPPFVLTYFGHSKPKRGHNSSGKVCEICFQLAVMHFQGMMTALNEHTPLYHLELPNRHDTVVLSDTDSDNDSEISTTEFLASDVVDVLNEHLQDSIDRTVDVCNVGFQVREAKNIIEDKVDDLDIAFQDTLALQIDTQAGLDRLRQEFYTFFLPKRNELNPVEIIDLLGPPCDEFIDPDASQPLKSGKVAMKKVTQVRTYGPKSGSSQHLVNNSDVVALEQVSRQNNPKVPPIGTIVRTPIKEGDIMYTMKFDLFGIWAKARIVQVTTGKSTIDTQMQVYRVRFEVVNRKQIMKTVSAKQLAYTEPAPFRYPVGTRVIAIFKDGEGPVELYYAGVVAEPPKLINNFRYLIFFDDGYTQYVHHDKVLLVAESSRAVFDDVHPDSRSFIKKYMEQYPERPMVKVALDQVIKTEWNGKWWLAKVIEVDCSLCNMNFLADGRTEWLYRGSTRLAPLYNELARANPKTVQVSGTRSRSHGTQGVSNLKRSNMPYIEYTRSNEADNDGAVTIAKPEPAPAGVKSESRAVAKKSTTRRPLQMDNEGQAEYLYPPTQGKGQYSHTSGKVKMDCYDVANAPQPKKFVPHQCGEGCIGWVNYVPEKMKFCGPLAVPLLCGWRRETVRFRGKKAIVYKAPCGRHMRQMDELARYLRITKSPMGVDYFDFDFWVSCLSEFVLAPANSRTHIQDLSDGKEYIPVPCVNEISYDMPEYVAYTSQRFPVEGVHLNLDTEFLIGCDCTDGCQDKDKCACWQLTFAGTAYEKGGVVDNTIGYTHKRLLEPVLTGIYECNSRCKCSSTCANRVVQNPLRAKLQVFKTTTRGWGIRSINDMPQGSFICIYAGRLLNEYEANEGGKNYGDEYLAELDYIEVVERMKEGYEDEVKERLGETERDDDDTDSKRSGTKKSEEDSRDSSYRSDDEYQPDSDVEPTSIRARLRARTPREVKKERTDSKRAPESNALARKSDDGGDDDCIVVSDDEDVNSRRPQRFAPDAMEVVVEDKSTAVKSIRDFFQETDMCYIMDAKTMGNIGRYLNHSCTPNVFVQNVFVDTHDLRFPWVAFFALSYIPAGTELTWDYNYDIGSVPGKVLHCHCGSADCRGRLL